MDTILNITNGDSAVMLMREAGISGTLLPWRDVLHEGPVPADLTLEELSEVRAQYLAAQGWGSRKEITKCFAERDGLLRTFSNYAKVVLWFEHDLYDQLQLLQILDWFARQDLGETALAMICTDQYLGMLKPEELKSLLAVEQQVTGEQLALAQKAWAAFRASSPVEWQGLLDEDTSCLPFLEGAIVRMLEEYPGSSNGLSRTAHKALEIIAAGEKRPGKVFGLYLQTEERMFMGDASFFRILSGLLDSHPPLLALPQGMELVSPPNPDQELTITSAGEAVLRGEQNWLEIDRLDHWLGGVHLTPENIWCWNAETQAVIQQSG